VLARRLPGFPLSPRLPFTPATGFGESLARGYADSFGPL
jgi:hypothetical protein